MFHDKRDYPRTPVSVPAILHDSIQNGEICCYVKAFGDFIRIGCYVVAEDFQKYAIRREVVNGYRKAATA